MSYYRHICADAIGAAGACAAFIASALRQELAASPVATLAVSGGSTPRLMFDALVNETHLLKPAAVPAANVHRILTERGPAAAAALYSAEIALFFRDFTGENPRFTVVQCGIGPDCHTASLFPGEPLINDRKGLVAAVEAAQLHQARITMLPRILLNAKTLVVLACGPDKARPLQQAVHPPYDPLLYPAQLLFHEARRVDLFADRAAAASLE